MQFAEENYEDSIIELFENMGYTHVYGPDIERDYYSPLFERELVDSIRRINPTLHNDAIADAVYKLHNFESAELIQRMLCLWIICKTAYLSNIMKKARSSRLWHIW